MEKPIGTGGFLDPDRIINEFGIQEGMKIADFGSGGGYFTILSAEKVGPDGKVYALDILEDKLDGLRSKAKAKNLDNIETIRTNLEILGSSSLSDNSQDMVLLANLLFQSNKKQEIIREGVRILKSGCKLIIIEWKKGTGGFGPPDNLRTDESEMMQIAKRENLTFKNNLDTGQFHYGLVFIKP
jgi:ubiquinone/menaquinone biosynthesis C-methylase UbiE